MRGEGDESALGEPGRVVAVGRLFRIDRVERYSVAPVLTDDDGAFFSGGYVLRHHERAPRFETGVNVEDDIPRGPGIGLAHLAGARAQREELFIKSADDVRFELFPPLLATGHEVERTESFVRFLRRPRAASQPRFGGVEVELVARLVRSIDETLDVVLHSREDPRLAGGRIKTDAFVDEKGERRRAADVGLASDRLEKSSYRGVISARSVRGLVEEKSGRSGERVENFCDALELRFDLDIRRRREGAFLVRHLGKARMLEQERARVDQCRDFSIAVVGKQAEEIAVNGFFPGPRPRGERSADEGVAEAIVERGGIHRDAPALAVAGRSHFAAGELHRIPVERREHRLHFVAEGMTSHLKGLSIDPLAVRLVGFEDGFVFSVGTTVVLAIHRCGNEEAESRERKTQPDLLVRGEACGHAENVLGCLAGIGH